MLQPIDIIAVPWDTGRRGWRMGAGPGVLLERGLGRTFAEWGHDVNTVEIDAGDHDPDDVVATTMSVLRATSHAVRTARAAGRFPLVLAGNCITTVGAVAGTDARDAAVVWLDAHGDLNTPDTSTSGFLDGMAAATLLGWCHSAEVAAAIGGVEPVAERRLLLVGARDLDPAEHEATSSGRVRLLSPEDVASDSTMSSALDATTRDAEGVWLHVDLDVLDPAPYAPANTFTPPGGLALYDAIRVVQEMASRGPVLGMTVSAYDPSCDPQGLLWATVVPLAAEAMGSVDVPSE